MYISMLVEGAARGPRFARIAQRPDMLFCSLSCVSVCIRGGRLTRLTSLGSLDAHFQVAASYNLWKAVVIRFIDSIGCFDALIRFMDSNYGFGS